MLKLKKLLEKTGLMLIQEPKLADSPEFTVALRNRPRDLSFDARKETLAVCHSADFKHRFNLSASSTRSSSEAKVALTQALNEHVNQYGGVFVPVSGNFVSVARNGAYVKVVGEFHRAYRNMEGLEVGDKGVRVYVFNSTHKQIAKYKLSRGEFVILEYQGIPHKITKESDKFISFKTRKGVFLYHTFRALSAHTKMGIKFKSKHFANHAGNFVALRKTVLTVKYATAKGKTKEEKIKIKAGWQVQPQDSMVVGNKHTTISVDAGHIFVCREFRFVDYHIQPNECWCAPDRQQAMDRVVSRQDAKYRTDYEGNDRPPVIQHFTVSVDRERQSVTEAPEQM